MEALMGSVTHYIDTHFDGDKHVDHHAVAARMALDPSVDLTVRMAMLQLLSDHWRHEQRAQLLAPDKRWVQEVVHQMGREWMDIVIDPAQTLVRADLAEWVIGKEVSVAVDGYVGDTFIRVSYLPKMVFETMAIRFSLQVSGFKVVVGAAIRLDPTATYRPRPPVS